jgi:hypothetical protein
MAMTKFNNWKKVNEGMEGPDAATQAPEPNVSLNKKLARFMGGATAQARVEDALEGVADQNMVAQIKVAMDILGSLASRLDDNRKTQFVNLVKSKLGLLNK